MTTQDLMDELHVDGDEQPAVERARATAEEYVRGAIDYNRPLSEYEQYPLFDSLLVALVTQIYFDKELSTGLSRGATMLLIQLRGRVLGGSAGAE